MENVPIIRLGGQRPNPEVRERFDNWCNEVYYPAIAKLRSVSVLNRYRIVKESPGCPETIGVWYFRNLQAWGDFLKDPLRVAISKDNRATWIDKYGGDLVWDGLYRLAKSFGNEALMVREGEESLAVGSAPVMHIAGFRLSAEKVAAYATWFNTTGCGVYLPLFVRVPGLKRVDCLEFVGMASFIWNYKPKQDPEYPPYVSIFHFESLKTYQDFEKSPEMAAFREGIKASFPEGLDYKWYVTYQLIGSWRK